MLVLKLMLKLVLVLVLVLELLWSQDVLKKAVAETVVTVVREVTADEDFGVQVNSHCIISE